MKYLFTTVFLFASASASATNSYICDDGNKNAPATTLTIDDAGNVSFPLETGRSFAGAKEVQASEIQCVPKGAGGRIFWNGSGPGSWAYRVPQTAFVGFKIIKVQLSIDSDNDGIDCRDSVLTCSLN